MELTRLNPRIITTVFNLEGMDCSDCELVLEHRLRRLDGILRVEADFIDQTLQVEFNPRKITRRVIAERIRQMGYEPIPGKIIRWLRHNQELLFSMLSGLLLLFGWLGETGALFGSDIAMWFFIAAYFPAGYHLSLEAFHSLRNRRLNTDLLMLAAALGAAILGEFVEGGVLIFLFSLGHALQERALDQARSAIRALGNFTPRMAVVKRGRGETAVPVEKLQLDEIVVVRSGERIPVDGEIISGFTNVNEAHLTGESLPIGKKIGDQVKAGSLNLDGVLEVRVRRLARDSTLARVMKLVENARAARSPAHLWVERFTQILVPLAFLIFLGLLIIPILRGEPFELVFPRAVVFLVASSPCALALGIPSALIAGIAQAARHGVMVKGGSYLENLGRLKVIVFDKTGTLTSGEPQVTDIMTSPGYIPDDVLELASSIAERSNHPLAQAICRYAQESGVQPIPVDHVESLTGYGLRAASAGKRVSIGSAPMFNDLGIQLPEELDISSRSLQAQGKTIVFVGMEEHAVGLFAIADKVRPETRMALRALAELGVTQTMILSGDNLQATASIAAQAGLGSFEADLMPEDKLAAVQSLVAEHGFVGMVGDGVNDAPALAGATVGIAIGSGKNDVALEAADVALMADDLCKLPFAVGLGIAVRKVTAQNLFLSIGSILLLVGFTFSGVLNIGPAVLLHEGATLLVVANSLRLLRFDRPCLASRPI